MARERFNELPVNMSSRISDVSGTAADRPFDGMTPPLPPLLLLLLANLSIIKHYLDIACHCVICACLSTVSWSDDPHNGHQ